ncbi:MAG TPA: STAS domain-containing protein [bacterium]|nr:STAS domain-containing protein [bacterium]HPN45401.1 STAS domain-containing protein [bacterium]
MENFNVNRIDKEDISVLYISGFLDAHTAPELEEAIQKLIDGQRYKLVINFKDLSYISSAGLGVFMGFIEQIREHSGDIKMSNMTPKIFRVFDLLGFPTLYDIVEDETLAIIKFRS